MELIKSNLTNDEEYLCDELIYKFNVSLKNTFANVNYNIFRMYCFNTCRQAAILGAAMLTEICSNRLLKYEFDVYELSCHDVLVGNHVDYVHAVIIGTDLCTQRRLLIDISRTEQPIMFCEISSSGAIYYPNINGAYEDLIIESQNQIDWQDMLYETEFFTGLTGHELLQKINTFIGTINSMDETERQNFADITYALYTERFQKSIGVKPDVATPLLITQIEKES